MKNKLDLLSIELKFTFDRKIKRNPSPWSYIQSKKIHSFDSKLHSKK